MSVNWISASLLQCYTVGFHKFKASAGAARSYPSCSLVGVKHDGGIGGDSCWLASTIMSLTVQLPRPDFSFQNLSVTFKDIHVLDSSETPTQDFFKTAPEKLESCRVDLMLPGCYWAVNNRNLHAHFEFILIINHFLDLPSQGLQILGRSADRVHTRGRKNPESSGLGRTELATWRCPVSGPPTHVVKNWHTAENVRWT